jgi:hypothetical protein
MNINELNIEVSDNGRGYTLCEGYEFKTLTHPATIKDAIVIKNPPNVTCWTPSILITGQSLSEQIEFVNRHKLEKAIVVAENISFLKQCPTFKYLKVIPSDNAGNNFDFSPLYDLPEIKSLECATQYGRREEFSSQLDYARIKGLEELTIDGNGHHNFHHFNQLKSLRISGNQDSDVMRMFSSEILDTLWITQCKIRSLEGIQKSKRMQCLYLAYNRTLSDISALRDVKDTIKLLRIENCAKIKDFSVLTELHHLELLQLSGSNELESLAFLKSLPNLRFFACDMNILDGDLTPCLNLSYVGIKKRKHYNLDPNQFSRKVTLRGNESIELWRRME